MGVIEGTYFTFTNYKKKKNDLVKIEYEQNSYIVEMMLKKADLLSLEDNIRV